MAKANGASGASKGASTTTGGSSGSKKTAATAAAAAAAAKEATKRRKVSTACIYCRRSHMTCDEQRPCKRCIRRDIGHLCHDESTVKGDTHAHSKQEGEARRKAKEAQAAAAAAAAAAAQQQQQQQQQQQHQQQVQMQGQGPDLSALASTSMAAAASAGPSGLRRSNSAASMQGQQQGGYASHLGGGGGGEGGGAEPAMAANGVGPYSTSSLAGLAAVASSAPNVPTAASAFNSFASPIEVPRLSPAVFREGAALGGTLTGTLPSGNLTLANTGAILNPGAAGSSSSATAGNSQHVGGGPGSTGPTSGGMQEPGSNAWGWGWPNANANVLGGAGFLGLGGGNALGTIDDASGITGDSAGGNEYNILSEFLESLDGVSLLTPGGAHSASGNALGLGTAGATPKASGSAGGMGEGGYTRHTSQPPPDSEKEDWQSLLNASIATPSAAPGQTQGGGGGPTGNEPPTPAASKVESALASVLKRKRSRGASLSESRAVLGALASIGANPPASSNSAGGAGPSSSTLTSSSSSGPYAAAPFKGLSTKERFLLTAADQNDGTRDERLGKVIQAKYDAGLLRPYNHVNGYTRLHRWMEQNVSTASRRRILHQLSIFRPAFRAVAASLRDLDLIYIEEAFERLLLDYDRVFSTQGIPACLWRRTGEIYKGNKEFADLIGVDHNELRDGKLTIYELMDENSGVSFWEKYSSVCMDPSQKAVLTSCVLLAGRRRDSDRRDSTTSNSVVGASSATATQEKGQTQGQGGRSRASTGVNTPLKGSSASDVAGTGMGAGSDGNRRRSSIIKDDSSFAAAAAAATSNHQQQQQQQTMSGGALGSGVRPIKCCFSFTIRRDTHGLPILIAGNFLQIDPPPQ